MTSDSTPPLDGPRLGRRQFVHLLGAAAAGGGAAELLDACGRSAPTQASAATGIIQGVVRGYDGAALAAGRIYLLQQSGLNTNVYVDVDADGRYAFRELPAGTRRVRFWGGAQYYVPEWNPNPVRVVVTPGAPSVVDFIVAAGEPEANRREIYACDDFFQEQPFGVPNAPVTVRLGTVVCWYIVGEHKHTVTGGPWGDSGELTEEFEWTADRVGTFDYRCNIHQPLMRSTLQVVP